MFLFCKSRVLSENCSCYCCQLTGLNICGQCFCSNALLSYCNVLQLCLLCFVHGFHFLSVWALDRIKIKILQHMTQNYIHCFSHSPSQLYLKIEVCVIEIYSWGCCHYAASEPNVFSTVSIINCIKLPVAEDKRRVWEHVAKTEKRTLLRDEIIQTVPVAVGGTLSKVSGRLTVETSQVRFLAVGWYLLISW